MGDALIEVGMGGEGRKELGIAGIVLTRQILQLFEGLPHCPGIAAVLLEEVVAIVIGLSFMVARVLGRQCGTGQFAQGGV